MASPQVVRLDESPSFAMVEGIIGRPLHGEKVTMNLAEMVPGSRVPEHEHPHEQLGVLLYGGVRMTIGGVEHKLGPMDAYVVPSGVRHGAVCGPERSAMLDVFAPPRDDYRTTSERT